MIGYTDGGCRNNFDGPTGNGWRIKYEGGNRVVCGNSPIPYDLPRTVNWAKYAALIALLRHAQRSRVPLAEVRMDSRLVVRQINLRRRNRALHLRDLRDEARAWLGTAPLKWMPRERNQAADAMARAVFGDVAEYDVALEQVS